MDYGDLTLIILLGIACAYPTRAMLLREQESHEGPFRSDRLRVRFPSTGHIQSVALFDRLRRLFGVYRIEGDYWNVREERNRVEIFTCQFCLSMYMSIPFTISALALLGLSGHSAISITVMALPVHFAIATICLIAYNTIWKDD